MAQSKSDKPSVATFADHEVITPPNKLRKAVAAAASSDSDPVARAEAALAQLSTEFSAWMDAECTRLDKAREQAKSLGFTAATHALLFHAAHDIKGEAATFGFPAVAAAAESLCRLLEYTPEMARIPIELVDQHVDAVCAILREYTRSDATAVAGVLTNRLREVTDHFLAHENRHRPDYIEGILAPPLAGGE